jgi:ketosteroid isomerase-like protein
MRLGAIDRALLCKPCDEYGRSIVPPQMIACYRNALCTTGTPHDRNHTAMPVIGRNLDHQCLITRRTAMKPFGTIVAASLLSLTFAVPAHNAIGQDKLTSDVDRVNVASQAFIAAIAARDIQAMDKVWAHEAYATFIGPLSTTVVVGWDDVRKAWEMRFGQFDRVSISMTESHVRTNGKVAWVVGIEKIELLRKDGKTLSFDAFATNVFEKRDDRWLMVSHQATPIFGEAR